MIRLILGQPGSGKSLSAVKRLHDHQEHSFTNFKLRGQESSRIRMGDVIIKAEKTKDMRVNWQFWRDQIKKHGGFHIFLDEIHNILHSRTSMTKKNILLTQWVAQIRKVTGENERYDLVCISQELERVDVAVRDLTYQIIACVKRQTSRMIETTVYEDGRKKEKFVPATFILQHYFTGPGCIRRYMMWRDFREKTYNGRTVFLANPYMRYYDSYELVDFGEGEYL